MNSILKKFEFRYRQVVLDIFFFILHGDVCASNHQSRIVQSQLRIVQSQPVPLISIIVKKIDGL